MKHEDLKKRDGEQPSELAELAENYDGNEASWRLAVYHSRLAWRYVSGLDEPIPQNTMEMLVKIVENRDIGSGLSISITHKRVSVQIRYAGLDMGMMIPKWTSAANTLYYICAILILVMEKRMREKDGRVQEA